MATIRKFKSERDPEGLSSSLVTYEYELEVDDQVAHAMLDVLEDIKLVELPRLFEEHEVCSIDGCMVHDYHFIVTTGEFTNEHTYITFYEDIDNE